MTRYAMEIAKTLATMSGRYSSHEIFADWIRMCALSIQNACTMPVGKVWHEREQSYLDTARRYSKKELGKFAEMFVLLTNSLEEDMTDALGEIYMSSEMGSSLAGQFFTPFHLSELTARLSFNDSITSNPDEMIELNEPTCGSGGMIIAMAKTMMDHEINYQKRLKVVAQDVDWRCVHMCYVQLSLLGIRAKVIQGNTLTDPYDPARTETSHIFRTPGDMGVLL